LVRRFVYGDLILKIKYLLHFGAARRERLHSNLSMRGIETFYEP